MLRGHHDSREWDCTEEDEHGVEAEQRGIDRVVTGVQPDVSLCTSSLDHGQREPSHGAAKEGTNGDDEYLQKAVCLITINSLEPSTEAAEMATPLTTKPTQRQ